METRYLCGRPTVDGGRCERAVRYPGAFCGYSHASQAAQMGTAVSIGASMEASAAQGSLATLDDLEAETDAHAGTSPDPAARAARARDSSVDVREREFMMLDPDPSVRRALATCRDLSGQVYDCLAVDDDSGVRAELLENPACPDNARERAVALERALQTVEL